MELLRDADINPAPLKGKRVAILGYGNQGRAQALNLKDSGIDVVVGLRGASGSARSAEEFEDRCVLHPPTEAIEDRLLNEIGRRTNVVPFRNFQDSSA